ncbi:MAG: nucleotidyltransferase domain-containing protein [Defluviicoccus sp.]|nr:nucleotidyltransferase domain-containing protein [Defluviicoccus sp.]MDE0276551.1 nucleotidyltransferase domain-containing protein [Defluviicoccus sp.]
MHPAISDKRERLAELCREFGVARLEVFGSAARGADFDPLTSDADFLVEFDPRRAPGTLDVYFDFRDALSDALNRPVDLLETGAIRNPYLSAAIETSRELVYES